MATLKGVYLSSSLDLKAYYGACFALYHETVQMCLPEEVENPEEIQFALAWHPADEAFDAYPNLRLVSSIGAGVDNILACPSLPPEASVVRLRDPDQSREMAAFALWHVIGMHRKLTGYASTKADKRWQKLMHPPASAFKVTILGYGSMSKLLARLLLDLGYNVTVYARSKRQDLAEGLTLVTDTEGKLQAVQGADIVVNLLPGTPNTRCVLDKDLFDAMATGSCLVNLGRGDHLVERDLLTALDAGQISHAALDVFEVEPLPKDHPFWTHESIDITPHIAAETTPETLAKLVVAEVKRFSKGDALSGLVDRDRAY